MKCDKIIKSRVPAYRAAYNFPQMLGFTCSQSNVYVLACYASEQSSILMMEENLSLPKKLLLWLGLLMSYYRLI